MVPMIIFLLVVGFVLWLLGGRIDSTIRNIIIALLVLAVAVWILAAFGIISLPGELQIGDK
jgi:hypothetical protein